MVFESSLVPAFVGLSLIVRRFTDAVMEILFHLFSKKKVSAAALLTLKTACIYNTSKKKLPL